MDSTSGSTGGTKRKKDGSKKISTVPKKSSSSRTSLPKKESSTDRNNSKQKKDVQETKTKETTLTSSLDQISEEKGKPKKSNTSTKVSSQPEKTSSTKVSSKSKKESSTTATKISLKHEKVPSSTSSKVSCKPEKLSSNTALKTSSRSTQDIKKISSTTRTSIKKDLSNHEVPSTPSSRIKKTQYFPSKHLYSNALKHTEVPENILEEIRNPVGQDDKISRKSLQVDKVKNISSSKVIKASPMNSSRSVRSVTTNIKKSLLNGASPDSSRRSIRSVREKIKDVVTRESSPDTSSVSERPKTATLRKGSIVNGNIVGPEAPKYSKKTLVEENLPVKEKSSTVKEKSLPMKEKSPSPINSDNYEDDFESYESDFEVYSSSEDTNLAKISGEETSSVSSSSEDVPAQTDFSPTILQTDNKKRSFAAAEDERAHDSGTFELTDFKHKQILEHIKKSVEKENSVLLEVKLKERANLSSLSDEGFEDQQSLQFINFSDAKKKCEKRRASEQRKKRGEEILSMIKLDNVNFTIFDSPAVPYEVFISSYGQNNTVQASAQTGEDDFSEGVQTEPIEVETKWTQMPIKFSSFDQSQEDFWNNYKYEYLGAGGDKISEDFVNKFEQINEKRLRSFLSQSVDLICDILAEANIRNLDKLNKNDRNIPFSDGYIQFNTKKDIFENTRVQNISIFSKNINHILTVHLKNDDSEDFIKSIVSIWDISDFDAPRTILVSYGEVCCATFSLDVSEYIFAGQNDGTILVWNVKEKSTIYDIPSRTPTFITDIGTSHFAKVVSVKPIKENEEHKGYFDKAENNEICSLDEDGEIIIWNLYSDSTSKNSTSSIVLINTASISLQELYPEMVDLLCTEFILLEKHIYVSTNYGFILHCILSTSGRNVKKFIPATKINATCLETCPFSSSFFLAGYSDGNITLYSRATERPLMVLRNNEEIANTSVQIIQWSKTKPFVLYAKDSRNTIHIWDLSKSDMFPVFSIPFKEDISCLKLSPVINIELEDTSYMLIGTKDGKVYLHLLNKEYGQESHEMYNDHVATFLNYVSRL